MPLVYNGRVIGVCVRYVCVVNDRVIVDDDCAVDWISLSLSIVDDNCDSEVDCVSLSTVIIDDEVSTSPVNEDDDSNSFSIS